MTESREDWVTEDRAALQSVVERYRHALHFCGSFTSISTESKNALPSPLKHALPALNVVQKPAQREKQKEKETQIVWEEGGWR